MSGVYKSFATVLKDHPVVYKQAEIYIAKKEKVDKKMPDVFNPFEKWADFLGRIKTQGKCGCCWAMSTSKTLAERYAILTMGKLNVELSPYEMVMCQGAVFPNLSISHDEKALSSINLDAHTQGACNGSSLFSAMDFMFSVGLVSTTCVNHGKFADYGIPNLETIEKPEGVPMCQSILGPDYDRCLDTSRAVRFYRTIAGYQISSDVESIKQEIYKWGPVAAGFQVFDDFISKYDGTSIYMGPAKGAVNQGGHAVEILGWGKENGVDFWWIANSWGTNWGLSGYFKMKMMIPECQLEQNVVGFIPDFPGFRPEMLQYTLTKNTALEELRSSLAIDPLTGYKQRAIVQINAGTLKGDITPLIRTNRLPDMMKEWLGELSGDSTFIYSVFHYTKPGITISGIIENGVIVIMLFALSYWAGRGISLLWKKQSR